MEELNKCFYCGRLRPADELMAEETLEGVLVTVCRSASDCLVVTLARDGYYVRHPESTQ